MKIAVIAFLLFMPVQIDPPFQGWAKDTASPPSSQTAASNTVYKLRVKNHWMANKTIKGLVELLGGTAKANLLKGSRPQTIRMVVSLPQQQSAYFLSKLSGLGELTPPSGGETKSADPQSGGTSRMTLDIVDP